jgi:Rrf2 family iron-sulfur cluster assembly transcriptional regulator
LRKTVFMFTKTFGYALRALVYITIHGKDDHRVGLHELSENLDIPHHFLGKIMQDMVRHGLLNSTKGPSGGFFVNDRTNGTHIIEILEITDGKLVFETCALGIRFCNSTSPCPLHQDFALAREIMRQSFKVKTLAHLAEEVISGKNYLAR